METNLHAHVEVRRQHCWLKLEDFFPNPFYDPKWGPSSRPFTDSPPRNYALFAVLAAVRNGPATVAPIASPRGLPADVTLAVRAQFAVPDWLTRTLQSRHSASWVSLGELLRYEWAKLPSAERYDVAEFCGEAIPRMVQILFAERPAALAEVLAFVRCWQEGDPVASWVLADWLAEQDLPSLDDLRLVYWFDT